MNGRLAAVAPRPRPVETFNAGPTAASRALAFSLRFFVGPFAPSPSILAALMEPELRGGPATTFSFLFHCGPLLPPKHLGR